MGLLGAGENGWAQVGAVGRRGARRDACRQVDTAAVRK